MATSRKTARAELVRLLTIALVGTDLPVKTVSGSKLTSLEGINPAVIILSGPARREAFTAEGDRVTFSYTVAVFVRQSGEDWTYAQAENALDDIEALIAGVCESNDRTTYWESLLYGEATTLLEVAVAGVPYYAEMIPIQAILGGN